MAVIKVEEFRGDHNKLYLTTLWREPTPPREFVKIAKKRFKVKNQKMRYANGWVIDNDLFLEYPFGYDHKIKRRVWVVYVDHINYVPVIC